MKRLCITITQIWKNLFEVAQIWIGLLESTPVFPVYGNISKFTQIWIKLF